MPAQKRVKSQTAKTTKPRPRRTREEGKQLLLEAAQKLLLITDPDELGIREIGALAGVHHRFVAEWFGGKVGLFRAVHDARTLKISELVAATAKLGSGGGVTLESIRHEIVLVNWLIQHGSHFEDIEDAFPALRAAKKLFTETFMLSEEDAEKSAHTIGAIVVADAMLRPKLKIQFSPIELIVHHLQSKVQTK
jgi:AcrR family transcriptional regulator